MNDIFLTLYILHHSWTALSSYVCTLCNEKFADQWELRKHALSEYHVGRVKNIFPEVRWIDFQIEDEFGVTPWGKSDFFVI